MMSKGYFLSALFGGIFFVFLFQFLNVQLADYDWMVQAVSILISVLVLYFLLSLLSPSFKSGQKNNKYYWCGVLTGTLLAGMYYGLKVTDISLIVMAFLIALFLSFIIPILEEHG